MPICINCRYPIQTLYTTYSKADDKTLGKGVRLTQCPRCKRFADKYVEHDFVVLFIDLVLIRPQILTITIQRPSEDDLVYRHLLFNRLGREDDRFDPSILRLSLLLLLFDVYLTWARIEKATPSSPSLPPFPPPNLSNLTSVPPANTGGKGVRDTFLATQPILVQYIFFLLLCGIETASFHIPIHTLLSLPRSPPKERNILARAWNSMVPYYPHKSLISTALLVSSFTKLFPLLLLVWNYDLPSSASAVSWAVIINNVAALEILLDCGYIRATLLAAVGAICRAGVGWGILRMVGVGGGVAASGVIETGDVIHLWRRLAENLGFG